MAFRNNWQQPSLNNQYRSNDAMWSLVKKLTQSPKDRAEALQSLSLQREQIRDLAPCLWYSPTTITALISEIISIYPNLATSNLNIPLSNRVCNVLALFQCIAGHDDTRLPFVRANIPIYLFPFLHQTTSSREAEYFKLTSLGIIGSLVKADQPEIIEYLLNADFVPLCLRILKFSQEISRTVAAFIVQKIIADKGGRIYILSQNERIETVIKVLNKVVNDLCHNFSSRLSRHVVGSYNYLLEKSTIEKITIATLKQLKSPDIMKATLPQSCDPEFVTLVTNLKKIWCE